MKALQEQKTTVAASQSPEVEIMSLKTILNDDKKSNLSSSVLSPEIEVISLKSLSEDHKYSTDQSPVVTGQKNKLRQALHKNKPVRLYTVKDGDTIDSVAIDHSMDSRRLRRINHLPPHFTIYEGQVLMVYSTLRSISSIRNSNPNLFQPPSPSVRNKLLSLLPNSDSFRTSKERLTSSIKNLKFSFSEVLLVFIPFFCPSCVYNFFSLFIFTSALRKFSKRENFLIIL